MTRITTNVHRVAKITLSDPKTLDGSDFRFVRRILTTYDSAGTPLYEVVIFGDSEESLMVLPDDDK